uniref:Putative replication-associated protein n=1 Tax=uncultured virus TaxID=340016 RepID=A0A2H4YQ43_9VIRU|nr:putative replication-associated protein [uncultured virus]
MKLAQECPEGKEWFWMIPGKWFDGYEGQPGIVFNDYRDSWMPYNMLLRLLESMPGRRVEFKGAIVRMHAHKFRFSTNVHPKSWYKGVRRAEGYKRWADNPLKRRFSLIELMSQRVEIPGVFEVIDEDEPSSSEGSEAEAPLQADLTGVLWPRRMRE